MNYTSAARPCATAVYRGKRPMAELPGPGNTPAERRKNRTFSAKAPRAADGKPDLTGVWAHELTAIAEFKRIFGASYEAESRSALIGMELEAVHKYGYNVLLDAKPRRVSAAPGRRGCE